MEAKMPVRRRVKRQNPIVAWGNGLWERHGKTVKTVGWILAVLFLIGTPNLFGTILPNALGYNGLLRIGPAAIAAIGVPMLLVPKIKGPRVFSRIVAGVIGLAVIWFGYKTGINVLPLFVIAGAALKIALF
jgi:hypothetical protein